MLAVGIKSLKNKLSEYVRRAAAGETVLITDRDRVVAELVPPASGRPVHIDDAQLASLMKAGLVRAPLLAPGTMPGRYAVTQQLATILADLDADRAER